MIEEILSADQYVKNAVSCERLNVVPANVIALAAGVSTKVLAKSDKTEFAYRRIQNIGDNDVYVTYMGVASVAQCHKKLIPNAELSVDHTEDVYAISVAGSSIATDVAVRTQLEAPVVNP